MEAVFRVALAVVLALAGTLKLASPRAGREALATFAVPGRVALAAWPLLGTCELGLAAAVAAGSTTAAYFAAFLTAIFALALVMALAQGRRGAPCACFGRRSRVSEPAVLRALVLTAGFAAVPSLPAGSPSTDGWLELGLAAALSAIAALAVAVLALARELGALRLQLVPQGALEIAGEGPPLGERTRLIERFSLGEGVRFALAVFSSDGCPLCRTLAPVVSAFERDPLIAVEVFDEERDHETWSDLNVPGSPFAVALLRDGTVGAKGTFNSFGQLESILAAAEQRAYA